jgi:hypothetical protein
VNKIVRVLANQIEGNGLSKKDPCGFVWFLTDEDIDGLDLSTIETHHMVRK